MHSVQFILRVFTHSESIMSFCDFHNYYHLRLEVGVMFFFSDLIVFITSFIYQRATDFHNYYHLRLQSGAMFFYWPDSTNHVFLRLPQLLPSSVRGWCNVIFSDQIVLITSFIYQRATVVCYDVLCVTSYHLLSSRKSRCRGWLLRWPPPWSRNCAVDPNGLFLFSLFDGNHSLPTQFTIFSVLFNNI
jgi:hypothetical protein